jgi:hypothetical protein
LNLLQVLISDSAPGKPESPSPDKGEAHETPHMDVDNIEGCGIGCENVVEGADREAE